MKITIAPSPDSDDAFMFYGLAKGRVPTGDKDPYYILPVVMGVTMLISQKMTPMAPGSDPVQAKMMMIMPVVFLFICYSMSSGLVLYWTVQQILSIAQQWWSMRQPDATPGAPTKPAAAKA